MCWDQAELDLFDLVEEIGENFYDVLHVDQVSRLAERAGGEGGRACWLS